MQNPFVWAGNQPVDQNQLATRRALANALINKSLDTSPVQHWTQGLARVAQAIAGMRQAQFADEDEGKAKAELGGLRSALFGGDAAQPAAPQGGLVNVTPPPPQNPLVNTAPMTGGDDLAKAANAITSIESGGRYDAIGPETKTGDRAYGRYQVMGANIPSWTKQYLGQSMTPEQFAASPEAQDAVFKGEFGRLTQKYGPEGAARAWFAGEKGMNNPNAKDVLGTTVADYSRKFTSAFGPMGQALAAAPQQVAQAPQAASAGQAPQAPAAQPFGGVTQDQLRAAYAIMNNERAGPGDKLFASNIIQKAIAAQTKDPLDIRLKQAQVQQAEAQAQLTPLQRQQIELGNKKAERDLMPEGARPLTPEERQQFGFQNDQAGYFDTKLGKPVAIGTQKTALTLDNRQESEFGKETGKALAQRFNAMATEGDEAIQNQVLVDELRRLGGKIQTGASAAVTKRLGDLGIKLEGASDIEAYSALVDRLTPQQRVPGSGATSDFDAKMFKGSLPSLMNTPGGNEIIIGTMEKLNANRIARGDIAMRVQAGELKPNEAVGELRKLQAEARALSEAAKNFGKDAGKQGNTPPASQSPATPKRAPSADPLGLFQ